MMCHLFSLVMVVLPPPFVTGPKRQQANDKDSL